MIKGRRLWTSKSCSVDVCGSSELLDWYQTGAEEAPIKRHKSRESVSCIALRSIKKNLSDVFLREVKILSEGNK